MDHGVAAPDKIAFNNKFYGTEHLPSYHSAVQPFVGDDWTLVVTPGALQHEATIWPLPEWPLALVTACTGRVRCGATR